MENIGYVPAIEKIVVLLNNKLKAGEFTNGEGDFRHFIDDQIMLLRDKFAVSAQEVELSIQALFDNYDKGKQIDQLFYCERCGDYHQLRERTLVCNDNMYCVQCEEYLLEEEWKEKGDALFCTECGSQLIQTQFCGKSDYDNRRTVFIKAQI